MITLIVEQIRSSNSYKAYEERKANEFFELKWKKYFDHRMIWPQKGARSTKIKFKVFSFQYVIIKKK